DLTGARHRVRRGHPPRRRAVRGARPAGHAREPGPVSAAVPLSAPVSRRSQAWATLRATGPAGITSAVIIAAATFLAIFGPPLAPYPPDLPHLSPPPLGPTAAPPPPPDSP